MKQPSFLRSTGLVHAHFVLIHVDVSNQTIRAIAGHVSGIEQLTTQRAAADLLKFVAYVVPSGTRDEGGIEQPAYLNFDAELLSFPASRMKVGNSISMPCSLQCKMIDSQHGAD